MIDFTADRWKYTTQYVDDLNSAQGAWLQGLHSAMKDHGLPDISVGPSVGAFLQFLVSSTAGQCAIEIGTLGGYSAAWIMKGLKPEGVLHTIERESPYAEFAREWLNTLGFQSRYNLYVADATNQLPELSERLGPNSVDFMFFDSDKMQYETMLPVVTHMIRPGGLLVADNALGTSGFWIDEEGHPEREALHRFNQKVFADDTFQACLLPLRQGILVARKIAAA